MFITLEGPEGSGKTSHIPPLVEFLREKGYTVLPTRELSEIAESFYMARCRVGM